MIRAGEAEAVGSIRVGEAEQHLAVLILGQPSGIPGDHVRVPL
jgi:hypothetical protein